MERDSSSPAAPQHDQKSGALLRGLALGLQLGLSFAVPLVVLALAGRWLDVRFGTFPGLFLGGIALASVAGFVLATRAVRRVTGRFE